MLTTVPRGTKDILPEEVRSWRFLEAHLRRVAALYGFSEIRTPLFEHTELFLRGIGETTDVVEKEMYSFTDGGGRNLTLRPENTAGVVRAYVEHKLYAEQAATKLFYLGPMFRFDRPQAGRYRQFHQFGVEALAATGPDVDAEVILLATQLLKELGLKDLQLKINSVGCAVCRPLYRQKLLDYFQPHLPELCGDCRSRYSRNPLRLLDCKVSTCVKLRSGAPSISDCLCPDCRAHFEGLKALLSAAGVTFSVDTNLVRGLDYYTRTAFEIQYAPLGAQSAVCGGGRYNGLVEELGGPATPAIGFAMGLERLLLALTTEQLLPAAERTTLIYAVAGNTALAPLAFQQVAALRRAGLRAEYAYSGRSLKAQLKAANRAEARYVLIFGEDEAARGTVVLRDMQASEQREIALTEILPILQREVEQDD